MKKTECKSVLEFIQYNYTNYKITESMVNAWFEELQQYDYEDVMDKLKDMTSREIYQMKPPTLMAIVSDLPKTQQKIAEGNAIAYCNFCGRAFAVKDKDMTEIHTHEDRCRSIRYINNNYSIKYKHRELDKKEKRELYQMSKEEFDGYYDKILKYIYDHTDNEMEKTCIGHIFNPPGTYETKKMFGVE